MMNVLHPRSSVRRRAPRASWPGRPAAQLALVRALAAAGLASFALVGADARAQSPAPPAPPALPTGLAVVQGQARVAVQGKQMTVTNSAGALLDWQSFSVGAGHGVRFEQPSAASRVLNRVVGRDPSQILGSLTSNGQVWLVNPYGVLFGRDARVDVGSLVVSTLNIGNDDWRAGRLGLAAAAGDRDAALVNQGELRTTAGGRVLLLGGSGGVRNEGLIVAPDGQVALAAGASVELVDSATPNVAVRVQAPRGEVLNLGSVNVGGGRVDLTAAMVNQQGLVRADAVAGSGGHIELRAAGRTTLGAGSLTSATGSRGGDVRVLGTEVALLDDSTIDVSGSQGGGSVLAGGGRQGRDASVPNARALYMGGRASIHADANGRGDGGHIVLWSDEATRVYGSLSARGGAGGGNGGFIETSGGHLDARPASVRADAPAGAAGQWLLDPNDILITDDADTVGMTAGPSFTSLDDSAVISSSTIEAALNDGNNVVVTTGYGGANSQPGDITVRSANIRVASKRRVSLTLDAERDIVVQNSSIIGAAGEQEVELDVTLNAATGGGGGRIRILDSSIQTGGALTMRAPAMEFAGEGGFTAYAGGPIQLFTGSLTNSASADFSSSASGTAILAAGFDGASNIAQLSGTPISLGAPNGRWLLYVQDDSQPVLGMPYAFLQYGSTYPKTALGSGDGIVFAQPVVLTLRSAQSPSKTYDATTSVPALPPASLSVAGLRPGQQLGTPLQAPTLAFVQPDVGSGIATTIGVFDPAVHDGQGRPVFGYTFESAITGDITPRPLTLSAVVAADKVYDGTRTATLSGGTLGNLVAGETLGIALSGGLFDTSDVGAGKPVSGTAALQDGSARASNYALPDGALALSASITPRPLTLSAVVAADKVYDGTRTATLSGGTLGNLVAGETLGIALSGGLFDTSDVGAGKPVSGTAALQDGSARASNYALPDGALALSASITPRPLTLSAVVAADKVYDGTRTATLSGGTLGNLVAGETLGLGYAGALFDTADVGAGKLVSGAVALSDGLGRASNYRLSAGVATARASIEPATLTYLADPVTAFRGLLPSVYTGSVGGFVGEETLSGATTGSLRFRALAADDAAAGVYPIEGGGLLAGNYVFVQAPSNATALTVVDPAAANEVAEVMLAVRSDPLLPPATGGVSRVFDATPALRPAAGGGFSFATLDIDVLPAASLSALLQAREMYMRDVWQAGMAQLDADPTLADMKPCESARQAASGVCLVTDEIVAAAQGSAQEATQGAAAAGSTLAALPTPTAAPVAAPPTAPRPSSGPQATGATAPSSAAAAAASAPVPSGGPSTVASAPTAAAAQPQPSTPAAAIPSEPPPATVRPSAQPVLQPPPLPPARAVSTAALPQIRRKFAVLFGNDNYKDASVPSLDNAGRDVDAMARVLESRLGYETLVVHDAGRRAMVGALNRLALAARPDDSVVVYYAGHGTVSEVNGRGYWIPADADASRPQSWLANADIERLMSRIRASQVVLVADSCFSGTLVGAPRRAASPDTLDIDTLLRRRTEVVMSSGGNEPVADGGRNGHSPFAASLMQALESLDAWRPGSSIYQRVRADVTRRIPQTPQYGPMRRGQDAAGGDYVFEQRQLAAQR